MKKAGEQFLTNLANLLKVKTILSLCVVITTCVLTFKNLISTEAFMGIAGSIVTYYFTKNEKEKEDESKL